MKQRENANSSFCTLRDGDGGGGCAGACSTTASQGCAYVDSLLSQRVGFGRNATGGTGGQVYHVTNLNDSGSGSLRNALQSNTKYWIVFDVSGVITLNSKIFVRGNKTVDGRGKNITIKKNGFFLGNKNENRGNVIIHNIKFIDGLAGEGVDAISIWWNTTRNVWIDHCTFENWGDESADVWEGASEVTFSWNRFRRQDKTLLIGMEQEDGNDSHLKVTFHHNYFDGTGQRNPKLRQGKFHMFNNYVRSWGLYAVGVTENCQAYVEKNIFEAGGTKAVDWNGWDFGSESNGKVNFTNNTMQNGAFATSHDWGDVFNPSSYYSYSAESPNDSLKNKIKNKSGWQNVKHPGLGGGDDCEKPAEITSPRPGSQITSSSVTVKWAANDAASQYSVAAGSTAGGSDIGSVLAGTATQATLTGIPLNGQAMYISVWSEVNGTWQKDDENSYSRKNDVVGGTPAAFT